MERNKSKKLTGETPIQEDETEKQSKFKEGQIVYHKDLGNIEVFEIRSDNFDNDITLIVGNDDLRVSVWESDCFPVQEHKPESEENPTISEILDAYVLHKIPQSSHSIVKDSIRSKYSQFEDWFKKQGFEITKKK